MPTTKSRRAAPATVRTSVRFRADLKKQAESLAQELGTDFSTVLNLLLGKFIRERGFNLAVEFPPERLAPEMEKEIAELAARIDRGEEGISQAFNSAEELIADLHKQCA